MGSNVTHRRLIVPIALIALSLHTGCMTQPVTSSHQPSASGHPPTIEHQTQAGIQWKNLTTQSLANIEQGTMQRSITLKGTLSVLDKRQVIGLARTPRILEATDEQGRSLRIGHLPEGITSAMQSTTPPWLPQYDAIPHQQRELNVAIEFAQLPVMPERFSRLRGAFYLLLAREVVTLEVPFDHPDAFLPLAPNLEVRFKVEDSLQQARDRGESSPRAVNRHAAVWVYYRNPQQSLPLDPAGPPRVLSLTLVDENGAEFSPYSLQVERGGAYPPGFNLQASMRIGSERPFQTIRLQVVLEADEVSVPFDLFDLPLP